MRIDHYHYFVLPGVTERLAEISHELTQLVKGQKEMAKTLDEVLADVADEGTKIDSLTVLVDGIEQQLKDALSGVTLPPDAQTKVDAIFDNIEANKAKVQAAIDKGTATPPPGGDAAPAQ